MGPRKRVAATVKLQLDAGQASPGKVGQSLGAYGINIGAFLTAYNSASASQRGMVVPALVTIYDDRSFDLQLRTPPTSALLARAAGVPKGSGRPGADGPIAKLGRDQLREIAAIKLPTSTPPTSTPPSGSSPAPPARWGSTPTWVCTTVVAQLERGRSHMTQAPAPTPPVANFVNPDTMHRPTGYTHVVEVTAGRPVYISGQVAFDRTGTLVGPGDVRAQARQVFENLAAALRSVGASFEQVVKLTFYLLDATQLPAVREVRDQYVNTTRPPASTAVEVRRLVLDDLLIEVEAVAIVP
jgi:ribosomal protein L11/enamine deaminase RidA (YjgF/YER057c/UK114 family)